jgi:hypothetical protein
MKKILTLLVAVCAFAALHAQSREQTRDVILGGNNGHYSNYPAYPNYPDGGHYGNDRQYRIDQINRDYFARIQSINNNPYMSRKDKKRAIKELEKDRRYRIDQVNHGYDRHDHGKHKGW